ncbi:YgjP-like metallopeptidase domain-containing protein [Nostoc sp. FACHB-133]|nr:M48 family metallopeptidase [Nostoc sp. FACHB-133]
MHCNHGDAFWQAVWCVMPDWRTRKAQLKSWEGRG